MSINILYFIKKDTMKRCSILKILKVKIDLIQRLLVGKVYNILIKGKALDKLEYFSEAKKCYNIVL